MSRMLNRTIQTYTLSTFTVLGYTTYPILYGKARTVSHSWLTGVFVLHSIFVKTAQLGYWRREIPKLVWHLIIAHDRSALQVRHARYGYRYRVPHSSNRETTRRNFFFVCSVFTWWMERMNYRKTLYSSVDRKFPSVAIQSERRV